MQESAPPSPRWLMCTFVHNCGEAILRGKAFLRVWKRQSTFEPVLVQRLMWYDPGIERASHAMRCLPQTKSYLCTKCTWSMSVNLGHIIWTAFSISFFFAISGPAHGVHCPTVSLPNPVCLSRTVQLAKIKCMKLAAMHAVICAKWWHKVGQYPEHHRLLH